MVKNKWGYNINPTTICAIDASTNSLAFALFDTKEKALQSVGKINFEGSNTYEKVMDAGKKVKSFFDIYNGFEAIVIEHTVFMNSPKTAADLALVQGAILGSAGQSGTTILVEYLLLRGKTIWEIKKYQKMNSYLLDLRILESLFLGINHMKETLEKKEL